MRKGSMVKIGQMIAPQTALATAEVTANLDTRGFDYATIVINFASEKNTNGIGPLISLLTDDTTDASNFATIVADRATETLVSSKGVVYHIDMRGQQRYLRLVVTPATGTNDNIVFGVTSILSTGETAPATTTDMVESGDVAVVV